MKVAEVGQQEQMWPTPRAAIGMTMTLSQGMANLRHKKYLETEVAYQEKAPGGTLNPTWVEWLMGYPAGYTELKGLGNSIIPKIAEEIGKAIIEAEKNETES